MSRVNGACSQMGEQSFQLLLLKTLLVFYIVNSLVPPYRLVDLYEALVVALPQDLREPRNFRNDHSVWRLLLSDLFILFASCRVGLHPMYHAIYTLYRDENTFLFKFRSDLAR
jgi:hypothetical protein